MKVKKETGWGNRQLPPPTVIEPIGLLITLCERFR
jgi:hypothetical protein